MNITQVNLLSLQGGALFILLTYKSLDIGIAGTEENSKILTKTPNTSKKLTAERSHTLVSDEFTKPLHVKQQTTSLFLPAVVSFKAT